MILTADAQNLISLVLAGCGLCFLAIVAGESLARLLAEAFRR